MGLWDNIMEENVSPNTSLPSMPPVNFGGMDFSNPMGGNVWQALKEMGPNGFSIGSNQSIGNTVLIPPSQEEINRINAANEERKRLFYDPLQEQYKQNMQRYQEWLTRKKAEDLREQLNATPEEAAMGLGRTGIPGDTSIMPIMGDGLPPTFKPQKFDIDVAKDRTGYATMTKGARARTGKKDKKKEQTVYMPGIDIDKYGAKPGKIDVNNPEKRGNVIAAYNVTWVEGGSKPKGLPDGVTKYSKDNIHLMQKYGKSILDKGVIKVHKVPGILSEEKMTGTQAIQYEIYKILKEDSDNTYEDLFDTKRNGNKIKIYLRPKEVFETVYIDDPNDPNKKIEIIGRSRPDVVAKIYDVADNAAKELLKNNFEDVYKNVQSKYKRVYSRDDIFYALRQNLTTYIFGRLMGGQAAIWKRK